MLTITIPKREVFDPKTNLFHRVEKDTVLQLEHSLISLQKWEAKWHKPFLDREKTIEETIDYVRCMCLTQNVKDDVFYCLEQREIDIITRYINDPMTATTIRELRGAAKSKRAKKEKVTAEIIYYWMISYNIPTEYRKWHLNQLLTLVRVLNIKNTPESKKKRNVRDVMEDYKAINEENKKRFNTEG